MRGRADPFDRPLDRALERLRTHGLPYRGDAARLNIWHAICPFCRAPAWALTLREHGHGGSIELRCAAGCDQVDIAAALDATPAAWRIEAAEARSAEALRLAEQARDVAERALDRLVAALAPVELVT